MLDSSVGARLDRLPITRTHLMLTGIVGIGFFFDIFDLQLAGVLGRVLTGVFHLNRSVVPALLGASFLGMFFGAVLLGRAADKLGRRNTYLLNLAIYSLFTLAGAFSMNAAMLMVCRFAAGVGLGSQLPLGDSYLSEILPVKQRGQFIAWAYTVGFLGFPVAGLLARVLVPLAPLGFAGWRWLFVVGSLGAVIVLAAQRLLPESPRWLESVGRFAGAHAIVEAMEGEAAVASPSLPPPIRTNFGEPTLRFGALFSREFRGRTWMLFVFQIFQAVGYYGFGTLVPMALASKGFSVTTSLTYTALTFAGYPVGSAVSLPLVERIDRKWLIVMAALAMAVCGMGLGFSKEGTTIVTLGFLYTVFSNVLSNAYHIFHAEIFPTAFRSTAVGTAYGLSRLSSAVAPFLLLPMLDRYGSNAMFGLIAAAMAVVMIDIGCFAPRTTGRTLEEIGAASEATF